MGAGLLVGRARAARADRRPRSGTRGTGPPCDRLTATLSGGPAPPARAGGLGGRRAVASGAGRRPAAESVRRQRRRRVPGSGRRHRGQRAGRQRRGCSACSGAWAAAPRDRRSAPGRRRAASAGTAVAVPPLGAAGAGAAGPAPPAGRGRRDAVGCAGGPVDRARRCRRRLPSGGAAGGDGHAGCRHRAELRRRRRPPGRRRRPARTCRPSVRAETSREQGERVGHGGAGRVRAAPGASAASSSVCVGRPDGQVVERARRPRSSTARSVSQAVPSVVWSSIVSSVAITSSGSAPAASSVPAGAGAPPAAGSAVGASSTRSSQLVEPGAGEVEQRLAAGVAGQGQLGLLGAALEPVEDVARAARWTASATSDGGGGHGQRGAGQARGQPGAPRGRERRPSRASGQQPLEARSPAPVRASGRRPSRPAGRGWRRGRRGRARRRGAARAACSARDHGVLAVVARSLSVPPVPVSCEEARDRRTPLHTIQRGRTVFGYGPDEGLSRHRRPSGSSPARRRTARCCSALIAPSFLPMISAVSDTESPWRKRSTMHSCCSLPSCCTHASSSRLVRCCDDRVLGAVGGPVGVAHVGRRDLQPVPAALHVVADDVAGDRDQPRADVAALEGQRVDPAQRPHEGLARDVLGRRPVADPVVDVAVDHGHVVVVELAERLGVALLGAVHQRPDVDALGVRDGASGRPRARRPRRPRRPSPAAAPVGARGRLLARGAAAGRRRGLGGPARPHAPRPGGAACGRSTSSSARRTWTVVSRRARRRTGARAAGLAPW